MAIYKNREVTVIGPNPSVGTNETITVQYKDGTHENVALNLVSFTEDEKKTLVKNYPSRYDDVSTVSDVDVEAVRVGVTPPSDPSYRAMAEVKAQYEKQQLLTQKNMEAAQAEADKQYAETTTTTPAPVNPKAQ